MDHDATATTPQRPLWLRVVRLFAGFLLILLGIAGLILPIMPGWIFLIPGLVMIGDVFPPVRRMLHWARQKIEDKVG